MASGTLSALDIDQSQFKHKLGDYLVSETSLGKGSYAKVRLARRKDSTDEMFAIKIIKKPETDQEKHYTRIKREVENLKGLQHPNIIKLHDVFQTKRFICIVMEYATHGDLHDYIKSQPEGRLEESEAIRLFIQIVDAISYMHNNLIVHRDLKPENVLLDHDFNVKVADFGFSRQYNPDGYLSTCCGSIGYAAPELLLGEKYVGPAADIWSMGVILYVMLVGHGPFMIEEGMNKEVEERMLSGRFLNSPHLTELARLLITKMLRPEKKKRISIRRIQRALLERQTQLMSLSASHDSNDDEPRSDSSSSSSSSSPSLLSSPKRKSSRSHRVPSSRSSSKSKKGQHSRSFSQPDDFGSSGNSSASGSASPTSSVSDNINAQLPDYPSDSSPPKVLISVHPDPDDNERSRSQTW
eukprot:TRINITY_DN68_c0_g1_i2.p1 TRINITY_DN68_c0_g1~~TRINITY_DN68_c0_g1_i2.p1  ORF type:complete len:411 (+),score=161.90 TRINITY_DN68_c0_g1_i2:481-1713(+)